MRRKKISTASLLLLLLFGSSAASISFFKKSKVPAQMPQQEEKGPILKNQQPSPRGNQTVSSFGEAKRVLPRLHSSNFVTLYCGCRVMGKKVDLSSCGYEPMQDNARAHRLEWEHIVPAEAFGQSFVEWREGAPQCDRGGKRQKGRKCAQTNPVFNQMEADLYNLYPEIGELNGLRSNYSMEQLTGSDYDFGACKAKIQDRKFEPMDRAKGVVARVYMYMEWAYPGHGIISEKNKKLYEAWDKMFPVTPQECSLVKRIEAVQGNANPIVKERCSKTQG